MPTFNERIKQILLLLIIIACMFLVVKELVGFLPGLLGAITLYIVSRAKYFRMVYFKKYKKGLVALGFIIFYLLILGIPIAIAVTLISPKIQTLVQDPQGIIDSGKNIINTIQNKFGFKILSENTLSSAVNKITAIIPKILNSTLVVITNLAMMLFLLYFMLVNGSEMERYLNRIIPLKRSNIQMLSAETRKVVVANALGIPLISIIQGLVATLGYFLFGVKDWALYGFLTAVCAFFPVVGTMIVWVPLILYMFATGDNVNAILLTVYSVVITGNVDYVARITLLKRMGDVHPVITIFGVIVGLGLFGFVGLVFGPLLINYIIVLYDIYMNEFVNSDVENLAPQATTLDSENINKNE